MPALLDDSLVIVLAGGAGERLYPLTKERAKPAVYFGGPYRIIDFALSNCINSGLRRIFIATQYKSLSLNRHIRMGWSIVSEELGEFVEILPPQKRVGEHWYQGTADAVYQNLYSIMRENPQLPRSCCPAITSTRWTTRACCAFHQERGAAVTLATIEVPIADAQPLRHHRDRRERARHRISGEAEAADRDSRLARSRAGVDGRLHLRHRRAGPRARSRRAAQPTDARFRQGHHPGAHPPGAGVLRTASTTRTRRRRTYWRDIGTLDAYFEANMDLCQVNPEFNLYDPGVAAAHLSAAGAAGEVRLRRSGRRCGQALDSVISPGCIVSGSSIYRQRAVPERARPQLLPHRAVHPDAGRARRAGTRASGARSSTATC